MPTKSPYINHTKDLPQEEHYVALIDTSLTYDDGYGSHGNSSTSTTNYMQYVVLGDAEAAKKWLEEKEAARDRHGYRIEPYRIIKVTPVTVQKTVTLELK